jgi:dihydrofolate reductase
MSENGVIGRDGDLPWRLSADLKRFRQLTTGHAIVMGRKTWESIGRPLPERRNIVISRRTDFVAEGADVVHSLDEALALSADHDEVFVIGGATIYRLALPTCDRLFVTLVHADVAGDVRIPEGALDGWTLVDDARHDSDEKNLHAYSFRVYEKARQTAVDQ